MATMLRAGTYRGRMQNGIRQGNARPRWVDVMLSPHTPAPAAPSLRRTRRAVLLVAVGALLAATALATGLPSTRWRAGHAQARPLSVSGTGSTDLPEVAVGSGPSVRTAFDARTPEILNLDDDLRSALRTAAIDAAAEGLTVVVNSGWRSAARQEELLRQAVDDHGSWREAARWVATPETSPHVSGDAVDLGGPGVTAWLARHGARYGLCQTYRNEPWHWELRPDAGVDGCPAMYADPSQDPRMHG
ncbi:M15 family metallopeptidase [Knoellia sp. CPCC 206450]|uniref:M15 family metallopeptidase n=1 Tax=Knoellia tibetensis TaxID=3404798 RepID=UPI003B4294E4